MNVGRRDVVLALVPKDRGWIVDVGADHAEVARALGAIATEREPHRARRSGVPWVIADGLSCFAEVPVAVIAGMGARTILAILDAGPRPSVLVAHAQDDPELLRVGLAARGWRIEAEALAPEAHGFAAVLRAVPGDEPAVGLELAFGPRLREHGDPHLQASLTQQRARWAKVADDTRVAAPSVCADATARVAHLDAWLAEGS
jgi:tRNA A22 N-methylase